MLQTFYSTSNIVAHYVLASCVHIYVIYLIDIDQSKQLACLLSSRKSLIMGTYWRIGNYTYSAMVWSAIAVASGVNFPHISATQQN